MFKLESYVTPLLLSYVNNYIKNLKPEDSQFCLWDGDACFSNLDLRPDVVEHELDLPFTLVNGHIHELRIHVPWTKLGSEPIIITINTIECILKLHGDNDGTPPESASRALKQEVTHKFSKREELEAPPGFVQNLINRVISNICIVCNNLILKYVEDDVVLSLNVKSVELFNVNEKWEKAFIDTNLSEVIVRKVITMQDLTVCLDKRDASGKIEAYQDPLLYRCSTVWRIYTLYNMPHAKYPSISRINIFCDKLDFSLTDQQLPMFLRLLKLCYALQFKDAYINKKNKPDFSSNVTDDDDSVPRNDDSWGSWMWSFVPFAWSENDGMGEELEEGSHKKILQFGIFIDKASCVFKITETYNDPCSMASKLIFSPFGIFHLYGCSMEVTILGKEFLNVQMGVTGATVTGLNECICGNKDFQDEPKSEVLFMRAGVPPGPGNSYSFLSATLFDPIAPENCGQLRKYCFEKDFHLAQLTEEVLVKRFPAFALDYVYELKIPDEWLDKSSLITSTFLEDSNWHESATWRLALGPFYADITSSFIHFAQKLLQCAKEYEYPNYMPSEVGVEHSKTTDVNEEDILILEEFVPCITYKLSLFKPIIRVSVADHPHFDMTSKLERRKLKKKKRMYGVVGNVLKSASLLLVLEISAECISLSCCCPKYPNRLAKVVNSMEVPSDKLVSHCYKYASLKLLNGEIQLVKKQAVSLMGITIIPSTTVDFSKKALYSSQCWNADVILPVEEQTVEINKISILMSESTLLILICIYQSWMTREFSYESLTDFVASNIKTEGTIKLCLETCGLHYILVRNKTHNAFKGFISSVCLKLQSCDSSTVLFQAPESTRDAYNGRAFIIGDSEEPPLRSEKWFEVLLQMPRDFSSDSLVMVIDVAGAAICFEPALLSCLITKAPDIVSSSLSSLHSVECEDNSTCSSQTPLASGSQSFSKSQCVVTNKKYKSFYEDLEQFIVDQYYILKHLIIQVHVESCILLFPKSPWCVDEMKKTTSLQCWKEAILRKKMNSACIVCVPKLVINNSCAQNILEKNFNIASMILPVVIKNEYHKHDEYFPWTVIVSNFSIYTIDKVLGNDNIFFFLNPNALSATIAATSKQNQNQLGLCIHIDTTALNIKCSASQVHLISSCVDILLRCTTISNFITSWMVYFSRKPSQSFSVTHENNLDLTNKYDNSHLKLPGNDGKLSVEQSVNGSSAVETFNPIRKITLWIQLTLSKFDLHFYGKLNSKNSNEYYNFQFTIEEIITSLDIQDVYSKAKMKISSLNSNCFFRRSNSQQWFPGPFDGVILCSNNKIRRHVKSTTNAENTTTGRRLNVKIDSQPFLLVTFTQALCLNANQKWTANLDESVKTNDSGCKYISEVDISVRKFDIILWMSLYKAIYDACCPLQKLFSSYLVSNDSRPKILFSNQFLPLAYCRTNSIRVFLPKYEFPSMAVSDEILLANKNSISYIRNEPDVLCFHLGKISLTSQVENPLSRIILNPSLYAEAVKSRTIGLPGSDVEDRQYQLNVSEISFSSVLGCMMMKKRNLDEEESSSLHSILGENPALQWNIGVVSCSRSINDEETLSDIPLLSPFEVSVTIAPAIVSNIVLQHNIEDALVSGITLEISIAKDVFIYVSARQLELINDLADIVIAAFVPEKYEVPLQNFHVSVCPARSSSDFIDSGIESEASTIVHYVQVPSILRKENQFTPTFIPFEILITASSVSFVLFNYEDIHIKSEKNANGSEIAATNNGVLQNGKKQEYNIKPSHHGTVKGNKSKQKKCMPYSKILTEKKQDNYDESSDASSSDNFIDTSLENASKMYPMFFISIVQPHAFMKCLPSFQKFEISCFDFMVKGCNSNPYIEITETRTVPPSSCFNLFYLETKPGEIDEKTGIPPSFCTLRFIDFLCNSTKMAFHIERPCKISASYHLWDKSESFIMSFKKKLSLEKFNWSNEKKINKIDTKDQSMSNNTNSVFSPRFSVVDFSTTHVLIEFSIGNLHNKSLILASFDSLKTEVTLIPSTPFVKEFESRIILKDFTFKFIVNEETWPIVLPLSLIVTLICHLDPYFQVNAYIDTETIFVNCHLRYLDLFFQIIQDFVEFLNKEVIYTSESLQISEHSFTQEINPHRQHWCDDLRKGSFSFIQASNGCSRHPSVHEIVFTKAQSNQPATMTWCYPEPRTLTKIDVSPVPFICTLTDNNVGSELITCYVQYWDCLHHKFVKKCEFQLSESEHCYFDFPISSIFPCEFSDIWRVILDYEKILPEETAISRTALSLSPLALAACMCIDSCFDPTLVPVTQVILSCPLLKLNFLTTFVENALSGNQTFSFKFDDVKSQEFMSVGCEISSFQCMKWESGMRIDSSFEMSCKVIEYRNLSMFPVLDPVQIDVHLNAIYNINLISEIELDMLLQSCFVKISQSVVHTLKCVLDSCKPITESTEESSIYNRFPNYYIMCNNTNESIRFGQIDTDENIILSPQHVHPYSWRSRKYKQLLRMSLECNKFKWSRTFSIDECGSQKISLENGYFVYIRVKALSNLQKKITVEGPTILFNFLDKDVCISLRIDDPTQHNISSEKNIKSSLHQSCCISFVLPSKANFLISMKEDLFDATWSEWLQVFINDKSESYEFSIDTKHSIWLQVFKIKDFSEIQTVIFICPPFIVRNHLPIMLTKSIVSETETSCVSILGKGYDTQILIKSCFKNDATFNLSGNNVFDACLEDMNSFSPNQDFDMQTLSLLYHQRTSKHFTFWPYINLNDSQSSVTSPNCALSDLNNANLSIAAMPDNPKISAEFTQRWRGLNTVLIDVKPWALFVNKLDCDVHMYQSNVSNWLIPANSVFVPPSLQHYFYISIVYDDFSASSSPIWLIDEKNKNSNVNFQNALPQTGSIVVIIHVKADKMFILQLKSEIYEGIRIITLMPVVQLKNNTNLDLHISLFTTFAFSTKTVSFLEMSTFIIASGNGSTRPLLLWGTHKPEFIPYSPENKMPYTLNFALCVCHMSLHKWSCPLRLCPDLSGDTRYTVAVPKRCDTIPLVVTTHKRGDLLYLTVSHDPYPFLMLHNHTNLCLYYGQAVPETKNVNVYEEIEGPVFVPCLLPGGSSHYTFPSLQQNFPASIDVLPNLQFGCQERDSQIYVWTPPIDVTVNNQFFFIPDICYIKISSKRKQHTIKIFVDVINRIGFTAEDVRNRIGVTDHQIIQYVDNTKNEELEPVEEKSLVPKSFSNFKNMNCPNNIWKLPLSLCLTLKMYDLSFIVCDELASSKHSIEVLRINIDEALMYSRAKQICFTDQIQEVYICFGNIQIDNQIETEDRTVFDFPVILKPYNDFSSAFTNKNMKCLPNQMKNNSFLSINMTFEFSQFEKITSLQNISISCQPLSLFLEDSLYYKIIRLQKSYSSYSFDDLNDKDSISFPRDVLYIAESLVYPLRIQHISIDIKEVFLTIHASLKIYLSIENSVLKFHDFEKQELFTNFYELGRITVIHYLTGALFQAGWVVGALDLIGNPVSFARAVRMGLSDFIRLPYHGFLNGPRCFVAGLSHGATSLISGVSSGAIMCVTNLATSISRNMDLLSLDSDHLERQEVLRRHLPSGITGGFMQGLSGFGISLLGAIAGIVNHPLQVLVSASSPIDTAKGVISGFGKGLIGLITKPVGGAAELVSQTGHGLLQGAGWLSQPKRKYIPNNVPIESFDASNCKVANKIVQAAALGDFLLFIEAQIVDEMEHMNNVILLLTSEVISILNPDNDSEQQTYSLSEVNCEKSKQENSVIFINILEKLDDNFQGESDVNYRVAAYVQKNWPCETDNLQQYSKEEIKKSDITSLILHVHPNMKNIFLSMFDFAKRKSQNRGFFLW